ncbi:MAG: hypothetical protein ABI411_09645 [Tahibacter sp.]
MNNVSLDGFRQPNRPTSKVSRRRHFRRSAISNLVVARYPIHKTWLTGAAMAALLVIVGIGVCIATAMVATALSVVVAQGLHEEAAALIPLGLAVLIFVGLGGMVRRWLRSGRAG